MGRKYWILLLVLLTAAAGGWAGVGTESKVATFSTGIGKEERTAKPEYGLKISFAHHKGALLTDVRVRIFDGTGNLMVDTHSDGPLFYAKLPPGTYLVLATRQGVGQKALVTITGEKQKWLRLAWW